jgi:arsenate reductase
VRAENACTAQVGVQSTCEKNKRPILIGRGNDDIILDNLNIYDKKVDVVPSRAHGCRSAPRRLTGNSADSRSVMTKKHSVLFVCIHNSARSQMAEAFLREVGGDCFTAESAGLEAGCLHPVAIETMREIGIDISGQSTDDVADFIRQGRSFDYVITVCDAAGGQRCPVFPGRAERLHWTFEDPAGLSGTYEEKIQEVRLIREQICQRVHLFMREWSVHG